MVGGQPVPENVQLRYGTAAVFGRPDTRAPQVGELTQGDAVVVLKAEGEFYQVRLADDTVGFVYALNLVGHNLPETDSERNNAALKATIVAHDQAGWLGRLKRLLGKR